jgi:GNAT superfamily N-acetyltransferase
MRLDLRGAVATTPTPLPAPTEIRPATPADDEALAVLMDDAYRGTIDAEPGQGLDEARAEIAATRAGDYGELVPEATLLAAEGDEVVSAVIVTRFEGAPFVAFAMTRSSHKGRGLSRALMTRSIRVLVDAGDQRIDLVVTAGNGPAERLYEALGFVAIETRGV